MNIELNTSGGIKSQDELQILLDLLKQEAALFIQSNSSGLFKLGEDLVQAILFKSTYEFVDIPPLSENPSLQEIVDRERILLARNVAFQLIAKAEIEHREKILAVSAQAEGFLLELLKKVGISAGSYLLQMLVVAILL